MSENYLVTQGQLLVIKKLIELAEIHPIVIDDAIRDIDNILKNQHVFTSKNSIENNVINIKLLSKHIKNLEDDGK
jgi:hypothetical protein